MATQIAQRSTYWVSTGTNTPNPYGDYRYYWIISYEQTAENKKNNSSKIIVDQYIQTNYTESNPDDWMASGYTYYPSSSGNIAIDDTWQTAKSNPQTVIYLGENYQLNYQKTYTKTIQHNTDGTRSFTWQGTGFGKYTTVSTYTLPQILRPTIINNITTFDIDNGISLPVTKYVSSYYDVLEISCGDYIKIIENFTNGIETGKSVNVNIAFTEAELDEIYTKIPTGETAAFAFKITTYKTSDKSATIGTSTKNITGNFTVILPTINGAVCTDRISNMSDYTGDTTNQTIVQNVSLVTVTIPTTMEAVANTRNATIVEYVIDDVHVPYNAGGTTIDLSIATKDYVTIYAVDSRGTSSLPYTQKFTNYIDYQPVTVNEKNWSLTRDDNGVSRFVTVSFEGTWWQGNFGAVENVLTPVVYYRVNEGKVWTDLDEFIDGASIGYLDETLIDTSTANTFKYEGPVSSSDTDKGFDIEESYDMIIGFIDTFSNRVLTITVQYGEPAIAVYKNKAAMGGPYDESLGGSQLWGDVYLNGNPLSSIFPVGSIYMSVNNTDPGTLFGGKWDRIKDCFLLAAGDTYENGSTGGEAEVALTIDNLPKHGHPQNYASGSSGDTNRAVTSGTGGGTVGDNIYGTYQGSSMATQSSWLSSANVIGTGRVGNNVAHNNMPPYLTVYMWKRIA